MVKRNYGIDLLRIVAMLMIVTHHLILHGKLLNGLQPGFLYYAGNAINVLVFPTINCYAMISGFGGCENTNFKYKKYTGMWAQVFTYSVIWGIIGLLFFDIGKREFVFSFFPVMSRRYWYFSAYTGVFFLMPFLNRMIANLSKKELNRLACVVFGLFVVYNTIAIFATKEFYKSQKDIFNLNIGNTTLFMILLYFVGAWIRKNEIYEKIKKWQAVSLFLVCSAILILIKTKIITTENEGFMEITKHNSIFMVGQSLSLVILFAQLDLSERKQRFIKFFAPSAFGVYLITDNPVFRKIEKEIIKKITQFGEIETIVLVLLTAFGIFVAAILIETIRIKIVKAIVPKKKQYSGQHLKK